jgi:hypothetical protein
MQPGFPFEVGSLYNGGIVNGQQVWTQPGGPGTPVLPAYPTLYPRVPEKPQSFPQQPFVYTGMFIFGCLHWSNTVEVFQVYDPYTEQIAALCCCPQCSYIQLIVEPASQWWEEFYTIYDTGFVTGVHPPS